MSYISSYSTSFTSASSQTTFFLPLLISTQIKSSKKTTSLQPYLFQALWHREGCMQLPAELLAKPPVVSIASIIPSHSTGLSPEGAAARTKSGVSP